MIARYQPVASDLRVIKSSMKIAYDLARLGRYAYDIVQVLDPHQMEGRQLTNHFLRRCPRKSSR